MGITQETIDDAIANCRWLSQNRGLGNMVSDICSLYCLPCSKAIDNGECDILIELFGKVKGESVWKCTE